MSNVFENERYEVGIFHTGGSVIRFSGRDYAEYYVVINRATGVIEYASPQLPEAIGAAESLDIAMAQEAWKWMRAQSPDVLPDGSLPGSDVH